MVHLSLVHIRETHGDTDKEAYNASMTEYIRKTEGGESVLAAGDGRTQPVLVILHAEELRENRESFSHYGELLHSLGSIRYCKAEVFRNCILGTLRIPQRNEQRRPQLSFGFYMTEQILDLIEDTGDLKKWMEKHKDRFQDLQSPDQLLLLIMDQMIENDILYLTHLEKEIEQMEDVLTDGISDDFFAKLTRFRQKLSEMNSYYEQLASIGDLIQSHDSSALIHNPEQWERYALRTERLQNHVQLLRENVLQLRELYQSQQDARQNKIMCILTVVTTIFLPLTLLTGWYGMNFSNMPELQWKYGYAAVIIVALVTVIGEIIYFKKKKFL